MFSIYQISSLSTLNCLFAIWLPFNQISQWWFYHIKRTYNKHCPTNAVIFSKYCDNYPINTNIARRYILNPLNQDKDSAVKINIIVKDQQNNNILFNDVAIPNNVKEMLNIWKVSGKLSLYQLELLATYGIMRHRKNGFLHISQHKPLINVQLKRLLLWKMKP